jgi:hypothetical protein
MSDFLQGVLVGLGAALVFVLLTGCTLNPLPEPAGSPAGLWIQDTALPPPANVFPPIEPWIPRDTTGNGAD